MRELYVKTIARDLVEEFLPNADITKIRFFNFSDGVKNISLVGKHKKNFIGHYDTTWVRLYDANDIHYDFIVGSLFFIINKEGVLLLCSEDSDYINNKFIAELIIKYIEKHEMKNITSEKYIAQYYNLLSKEIKYATKHLIDLFSVTNQSSSSRADVEDTYRLAKEKLAKEYLLNLISRKLIKENRDEILELID